MDSHVHIVRDALVERLGTQGTLVFLAVTMDLHVATKISSIVEVLATHSAGSRELPGTSVYRHVVFEVTQL